MTTARDGGEKTVRARVLDVLVAQPRYTFCITCLSRLVDASEASARMATITLEGRPGVRRGYGRCSACGEDRLVTVADGLQ